LLQSNDNSGKSLYINRTLQVHVASHTCGVGEYFPWCIIVWNRYKRCKEWV